MINRKVFGVLIIRLVNSEIHTELIPLWKDEAQGG